MKNKVIQIYLQNKINFGSPSPYKGILVKTYVAT